MSSDNPDPKPVAGLHLVSTVSREESSLASDVVDILQEGLRGGTDTDTGGVETGQATTLEQDEARRTEAYFFRAIADKLKERIGDWANGKRGVAFGDLGERNGYRIGVYDKDGRLFEIELLYSEIAAVAAMQRHSTLSNFEHTLDRIVAKFQEARRVWFARRDGYALQ